VETVNLSAISAPVQGRYEIKLVCPSVWLPQVYMLVRLHPEAFYEHFSSWRVNSIYFDTLDVEGVVDNLDGASERNKLRWRWYGPDWLIKRSHLELKCKRGMVGFKEKCSIADSFDPQRETWTEALAFLRRQADNRFRVWLSQVSCATIITLYKREYFASRDDQVRLTLDTQLVVYDQRFSRRPNLRYPTPLPDTMVIELKADASTAERLSDVLNALPFRPARNSKYVNSFLITAEALGGVVVV
jgi:hypothetical protein